MRAEVQAVAERYARRNVGDLYSMLRPDVWMSLQERQREILRLLSRYGPGTLRDLRLFEVGCGTGGNLLDFLRMGFDARNLVGNELLPDRMDQARRTLPKDIALFEGDATELQFNADSYDVICAFVVFSSLLDDAFQERLAAKLWEWLRPGGAILWYDFIYDNPSNSDVRGVPVKRIHQLFPRARTTVTRVTLAPPIARRVCRVHPALYTVFAALPPLRTHVLCWISKQ